MWVGLFINVVTAYVDLGSMCSSLVGHYSSVRKAVCKRSDFYRSNLAIDLGHSFLGA